MRITEQMIFENLFFELKQKTKGIEINREFDIKYLAGYNVNGNILYIDRDFPKKLNFDEFIAFHEICEKFFESTSDHGHYERAHILATKLEHYLVSLHGLNSEEYEEEVQKWIKIIGNKKLKKSPKDLDLEPYKDENDWKAIEEIKNTQTNS